MRGAISAMERPSFRWSALSLALPAGATGTRATVANYFDSAGLLQQAGSNVPRYTYSASGNFDGLWIEGAATNLALWCRDWTNAAWVKVNTTAVLDQAGLGGGSNTATSLLATAGNATTLQTVVSASAERTFAVYLKRITGSGTINITQDGTTWTAVAALSSTAWTRVKLTATQTNPVFGLQIVTNTDKIAVDGAQLEAFEDATSPILTTTASATRNAESLSFSITRYLNPAAGTVIVSFVPYIGTPLTSFLRNILAVSDGSTNNRATPSIAAGTSLIGAKVTSTTSQLNANVAAGDIAVGVRSIAAVSWSGGAFPSVGGNGQPVVLGTATAAPVGLATAYMGISETAGTATSLHGTLKDISIYPFQLTPYQLQALTMQS